MVDLVYSHHMLGISKYLFASFISGTHILQLTVDDQCYKILMKTLNNALAYQANAKEWLVKIYS